MLRFDRRCPKQNTVARLKSKDLTRKNFCLATPRHSCVRLISLCFINVNVLAPLRVYTLLLAGLLSCTGICAFLVTAMHVYNRQALALCLKRSQPPEKRVRTCAKPQQNFYSPHVLLATIPRHSHLSRAKCLHSGKINLSCKTVNEERIHLNSQDRLKIRGEIKISRRNQPRG